MEHIGDKQQRGHYNAKCWNENKEKWYLVDDKFSKEVDVTRLASENACNLIYVKINEEDREHQTYQSIYRDPDQPEIRGISSPWKEKEEEKLTEILMTQGEIDIMLDAGEKPKEKKRKAERAEPKDKEPREVNSREKNLKQEQEQKRAEDRKSSIRSSKSREEKDDSRGNTLMEDETETIGKGKAGSNDEVVETGETYQETKTVNEEEKAIEVDSEVGDKRNRKMTAKAMEYQETVHNKDKTQQEVRMETEIKDGEKRKSENKNEANRE